MASLCYDFEAELRRLVSILLTGVAGRSAG
jgi:hypothetical protein